MSSYIAGICIVESVIHDIMYNAARRNNFPRVISLIFFFRNHYKSVTNVI